MQAFAAALLRIVWAIDVEVDQKPSITKTSKSFRSKAQAFVPASKKEATEYPASIPL